MNQPVSITLNKAADYEEWRRAACRLLAAEIRPEQVGFSVGPASADLFAAAVADNPVQPVAAGYRPRVAREFPKMARTVLCHSDESRFALLYRILWRQCRERGLLNNPADADIARARQLAKSVKRDSHKMKAFVRFRRVDTDAGEAFVAWFEPQHHIVERTAPFFVRRFAGMRWSILTPERSAHWDGQTLSFGDGAGRRDCPDSDSLENYWRVYYASIFNPARLKLDAMRAEMPVRYWRNLPESRLIPELSRSAQRAQRAAPEGTAPSVAAAQKLVAKQPAMASQPVALPTTLAELAAGLVRCTRCTLCGPATAAVAGEGPVDARLVIVGEQPGDKEDLSGRPFVGPAGQVLDSALRDAGIEREKVYLTNAVKHFKFRLRGKRRIHQRPNASEIEHCRWWLDMERKLVSAPVTVALGATAARAVLGRPVRVSEHRGMPLEGSNGEVVVVTVHPAYLLRLQDPAQAAAERQQFIGDLRSGLSLASAH